LYTNPGARGAQKCQEREALELPFPSTFHTHALHSIQSRMHDRNKLKLA